MAACIEPCGIGAISSSIIGLICKAWKDQTQQPKAIDAGRKFMWLNSLADNQ